MKIIVFGGSGFLGSHVADAAQAAGHDVAVFDQQESAYLSDGQEFIQGDILDRDTVAKAVEGRDVVYNFAGMADIETAAQKPLDTVKFNVLGTTTLLDAAQRAGVKRFVFASSVYVYSSAGSFYRTSKRACEMLIEDFYEAFDLPYTILRYGSLYGPRSTGNNFIHRILSQALDEKKIEREGDGEEIREYIHVADAARNSIEILAPEFENQIINLTGMNRMKVKELLTMIREILNQEIDIVYTPVRHSVHYQVTPYNYNPRLGRKYVASSYIDIGQGLLDFIGEIDSMRGGSK